MSTSEAKAKITQAIGLLREAVTALDAAGLSETADELARETAMVRIQLTVIEAIEKAPDWPEGVPTIGTQMLRQAQGVE